MARHRQVCSRPGDFMRWLSQHGLILLLILSVSLYDVSGSANDNKRGIFKRREKRTVSSTPSQNGTNVSDILSRLPQLSHADLLQYTPRAPSPENVNCYVEVPVTQRIGGRCVVLGNQMVGCQAGMYLAFSSECEGTTDSTSNRRRSVPSPRTRTNRPNRSRP